MLQLLPQREKPYADVIRHMRNPVCIGKDPQTFAPFKREHRGDTTSPLLLHLAHEKYALRKLILCSANPSSFAKNFLMPGVAEMTRKMASALYCCAR